MQIVETEIQGPLIVEPRVFGDARGYFYESFNARDFAAATGLDVVFVQDNESLSSAGVMRGLHFQRPPHAQAKLVRCVRGRILDVALDIRHGSPTYGKYVAVELSGDNHRQFYIPEGFAHGFAVLDGPALFQYKCSAYYEPSSEGGISILDESLGIDWGILPGSALLSEKDMKYGPLADFDSPFRL